MGIYFMLIMLELDGQKLTYTQDELVDLGLGIATGNISREQIERWIGEHISEM